MQKRFPLIALLACSGAMAQPLLIDFGLPAQMTGGNWNNSYRGSSAITNMIDENGAATGISLNFITDVAFNNNFNSQGGPSPFDAFSAYNDAIFVGGSTITVLRLSGLEVDARYELTFYGSRSATSERVTEYVISGTAATGDGAGVTLTTSGPALGGEGVNLNATAVATVSEVSPNASGEIYVDIVRQAGTFGYLNAMSLSSGAGKRVTIPEPSTWAWLAVLPLTLLLRRRLRR